MCAAQTVSSCFNSGSELVSSDSFISLTYPAALFQGVFVAFSAKFIRHVQDIFECYWIHIASSRIPYAIDFTSGGVLWVWCAGGRAK